MTFFWERNRDPEIIEALLGRDARRVDWALAFLLRNKGLAKRIRRLIADWHEEPALAPELHADVVIIFQQRLLDGGYDPSKGNIEQYIAGIAKWHLYSLRRSQKRALNRAEKAMELELEEVRRAEDDRMRLLIYAHFADQFRGNCQEIFTLLSVSYTPKEIMEKLGYSSIEITRTRISECKQKLWNKLEEYPEFKKFFNKA